MNNSREAMTNASSLQDAHQFKSELATQALLPSGAGQAPAGEQPSYSTPRVATTTDVSRQKSRAECCLHLEGDWLFRREGRVRCFGGIRRAAVCSRQLWVGACALFFLDRQRTAGQTDTGGSLPQS